MPMFHFAADFLKLFYMLLLAWVFVPFYISSAVFTMPQYADFFPSLAKCNNSRYLEMRYGPVCRTLYACLSLLMYVLSSLSENI